MLGLVTPPSWNRSWLTSWTTSRYIASTIYLIDKKSSILEYTYWYFWLFDLDSRNDKLLISLVVFGNFSPGSEKYRILILTTGWSNICQTGSADPDPLSIDLSLMFLDHSFNKVICTKILCFFQQSLLMNIEKELRFSGFSFSGGCDPDPFF